MFSFKVLSHHLLLIDSAMSTYKTLHNAQQWLTGLKVDANGIADAADILLAYKLGNNFVSQVLAAVKLP